MRGRKFRAPIVGVGPGPALKLGDKDCHFGTSSPACVINGSIFAPVIPNSSSRVTQTHYRCPCAEIHRVSYNNTKDSYDTTFRACSTVQARSIKREEIPHELLDSTWKALPVHRRRHLPPLLIQPLAIYTRRNALPVGSNPQRNVNADQIDVFLC